MRGCSCRGASGFVHVSCLARQAQVLVAEAEERDFDSDAFDARWARWFKCRLCEQDYHGIVACALGWACWKTYVGRPETDWARRFAMSVLGNGLSSARRYEAALPVQEAEFSMLRRLGAPKGNIFIAQGNLAVTYRRLGRHEQALCVRQDVYSGWLKLEGEEHISTIRAANNYAISLKELSRFEEAKSLLRTTIPVARRVLRESHDTMLRMRWNYAEVLYKDDRATHGELREAVNTFEELARTARRVLGGSHPTTGGIEGNFRRARDTLYARGLP